MTKKLSRTIITRVEPDLDDWLKAVSDDEGRSKAQTVR